VAKIDSIEIPKNIQSAMNDLRWKAIVMEEMTTLVENHTWDIVQLPSNKKVVGCKWVFIVKTHADGSIERYKVRLVAQGYTQMYVIDYAKTFALMTKLNSI